MVAYMAISLAGHDKNRLYMIIEEREQTVLLSDGNLRPIQKMKMKKKKHIQLIKQIIDPELADRIRDKKPFRDEEVKHALKIYQEKLDKYKDFL